MTPPTYTTGTTARTYWFTVHGDGACRDCLWAWMRGADHAVWTNR